MCSPPTRWKSGEYSIFSSGPAPRSTFAMTANTTGRPVCCLVGSPNRATRAICEQHATELKEVTWQRRMVNGQPGMRFTAEVHYAVDRLPSCYDTVTAVLVRLDDGR